METNANTTPPTTTAPTTPALLETPAAQTAFATTRTAVKVYAALSTAALLAVVAVASTGHMVNPFMWTRAVLLPFIAVLLHRLTLATAHGSRRAYDRLRTLTVVFPIAITGVDLIPGVCPWWYAALQTACVLPPLRIALTMRTPPLRAAFPKPKSR
ncbi:hypothetical protein BX286_6894 [Streptomyces sp. 3211.6]|uniref:hypothetical protein n=1 Tax=Streptomyces TaxID=1883 RepID=UPI0009A49BBA|nr:MULTISPECIES: hypothetical protein [Streptomyces]RKS97083.1 hypothetical protein BX286_6894 [Streptomyces sp. 3211.6]RPF25429.1 hypothetical protein EDD96_6950 [Streptomyces sp. Ag109_G2-6]